MSRQNAKSESSEMANALQSQASNPPPPSIVRCPLQDLTWIEICLIDTEGNPVKGTRYKVTDPAGTVKEGTLDNNGKARLDGMKSGDCTISFPELDEAAWEWV